MRTLLAIVIGLVLLGAVYAVGRRRSGPALRKGLAAFGVVWFVLCVIDLFIGVWNGYSFAEEIPIHLLIFAVPVGAAFALGRTAAP
jgi:hypothetical protein